MGSRGIDIANTGAVACSNSSLAQPKGADMKSAIRILAVALVIGMWIAGCHAEGDVGKNASSNVVGIR